MEAYLGGTSATAGGQVRAAETHLQKTAVGAICGGIQKTEDRRQKSEDRRQRTEDRGQKTEDRSRRAEDRGQKPEDRGQRTDDRSQRTEDNPAPAAFRRCG
jgi:hypothetical protein